MADTPRLQQGFLLGNRFKVRDFVARGGFAEVYEASDQRLDGPVCIKLLNEAAHPSATDRFKREAIALTRLRGHAHFPMIYDEPDDAGQYKYVVLEFVAGPTLRDLTHQEGPLPPDRAQALLEQLLQAAGILDDHEIVHRDLSSKNVLIASDGVGGERAVVIDFGLAKGDDLETTRPPGVDPLTAVGEIMGTQGYIAPETASSPADHRADLFSVGCVAYRALTGEDPPSATAGLQSLALPANCAAPAALRYVVDGLLDFEPSRRLDAPTALHILQSGKVSHGAIADDPGQPTRPSSDSPASSLPAGEPPSGGSGERSEFILQRALRADAMTSGYVAVVGPVVSDEASTKAEVTALWEFIEATCLIRQTFSIPPLLFLKSSRLFMFHDSVSVVEQAIEFVQRRCEIRAVVSRGGCAGWMSASLRHDLVGPALSAAAALFDEAPQEPDVVYTFERRSSLTTAPDESEEPPAENAPGESLSWKRVRQRSDRTFVLHGRLPQVVAAARRGDDRTLIDQLHALRTAAAEHLPPLLRICDRPRHRSSGREIEESVHLGFEGNGFTLTIRDLSALRLCEWLATLLRDLDLRGLRIDLGIAMGQAVWLRHPVELGSGNRWSVVGRTVRTARSLGRGRAGESWRPPEGPLHEGARVHTLRADGEFLAAYRRVDVGSSPGSTGTSPYHALKGLRFDDSVLHRRISDRVKALTEALLPSQGWISLATHLSTLFCLIVLLGTYSPYALRPSWLWLAPAPVLLLGVLIERRSFAFLLTAYLRCRVGPALERWQFAWSDELGIPEGERFERASLAIRHALGRDTAAERRTRLRGLIGAFGVTFWQSEVRRPVRDDPVVRRKDVWPPGEGVPALWTAARAVVLFPALQLLLTYVWLSANWSPWMAQPETVLVVYAAAVGCGVYWAALFRFAFGDLWSDILTAVPRSKWTARSAGLAWRYRMLVAAGHGMLLVVVLTAGGLLREISGGLDEPALPLLLPKLLASILLAGSWLLLSERGVKANRRASGTAPPAHRTRKMLAPIERAGSAGDEPPERRLINTPDGVTPDSDPALLVQSASLVGDRMFRLVHGADPRAEMTLADHEDTFWYVADLEGRIHVFSGAGVRQLDYGDDEWPHDLAALFKGPRSPEGSEFFAGMICRLAAYAHRDQSVEIPAVVRTRRLHGIPAVIRSAPVFGLENDRLGHLSMVRLLPDALPAGRGLE